LPFTVAICGKGGTGKTTLSVLLLRALLASGRKPVLAVDADSASSLSRALGYEIERSIGDIREDSLKAASRMAGVSKQQYIDLEVNECIDEHEGFDILTMGRGEGPGCYCYVNNLLRGFMSRLKRNYRVILIDSAAGMEHISRQTVAAPDALVLVANPTAASLRAAAKIRGLGESLDSPAGKALLVINRARPGSGQGGLQELVSAVGAERVFHLPYVERIGEEAEVTDAVPDLPEPPAEILEIVSAFGIE